MFLWEVLDLEVLVVSGILNLFFILYFIKRNDVEMMQEQFYFTIFGIIPLQIFVINVRN